MFAFIPIQLSRYFCTDNCLQLIFKIRINIVRVRQTSNCETLCVKQRLKVKDVFEGTLSHYKYAERQLKSRAGYQSLVKSKNRFWLFMPILIPVP